VFEQLRQATAALRRVLVDLEPGCLDGAQARRLVEEFAEAERLAAAGKAIARRRVEQTRAWAHAGAYRDAAGWLAATTGTTVGAARATVETAQRLESLPETEAALRAGELSTVQANEIADAASADPSAERALLESAHVDGVKGLKDRCARVKAAARDDETAHYEAIRRRRSLRHWADPEGAAASTSAARSTPPPGSWPRSSPTNASCSKPPATRERASVPTPSPSTRW
jgi:hypothetical protein